MTSQREHSLQMLGHQMARRIQELRLPHDWGARGMRTWITKAWQVPGFHPDGLRRGTRRHICLLGLQSGCCVNRGLEECQETRPGGRPILWSWGDHAGRSRMGPCEQRGKEGPEGEVGCKIHRTGDWRQGDGAEQSGIPPVSVWEQRPVRRCQCQWGGRDKAEVGCHKRQRRWECLCFLVFFL